MVLMLAIILSFLVSADTANWCNLYNGGCDMDGNWSAWGDWSECSEACGGGTQSHSRSCTNPAPAYGGAQCVGEDEKERECNTDSCKEQILDFPGTYRDWVQVTTDNTSTSMDAFSICTWFKLTDLTEDSYFFSFKDENNTGATLYYYHDGDIQLGIAGNTLYETPQVALEIDFWYHVCGTFSAANDAVLYLDGDRMGDEDVMEFPDVSFSQDLRAVAGQYQSSTVDAYKNDPGFSSYKAMKGALKDTFLVATELTQEDVTSLASQFCDADLGSVAGEENILVSWSDLLTGKYNGDLVETYVDCPDIG